MSISTADDILNYKHDVSVQLSGRDGNAFAVMNNCKKAIEEQLVTADRDFDHEEWVKQRREARGHSRMWLDRAMQAASYDDLLAFCLRTLDVR